MLESCARKLNLITVYSHSTLCRIRATATPNVFLIFFTHSSSESYNSAQLTVSPWDPETQFSWTWKNMRITSNWREVLKIFFPTSGFGWCFDASRLTNFLLEMDFSLRSFCFQQNFSGAMCVCASRSKTKNHLRWEPTTTSSSIPVAVDWNQKNSMRVVMVLETKLTTRSRRRKKQQWQQISPCPDRCFFLMLCVNAALCRSAYQLFIYILYDDFHLIQKI